jgi:acetyl esterase/lipase
MPLLHRRPSGSRRAPPPPLPARARAVMIVLLLTAFAITATAGVRLPESASLLRTALLMPSLFGTDSQGASRLVSDDMPLSGAEPGAAVHVRRPAAGRHATFIVALGLHPADPHDPRVLALLNGLAARGVTAALVESPALDADQLTLDAPNDLVAAFQRISDESYVDPGRVGFLGFSVGGSLALLAAGDPRIASRVRLVVALGPYASLDRVARATLTGEFPTASGSESWHPDTLTRTAVPENLIDLLAAPPDQAILLPLLSPAVAGPATPPEGLSPTGQVISRLLAATDGQAFDSALASLPAEQIGRLRSLSPVGSVAGLDAPVYLMVDRHDPLIPPVESVALSDALERAGHGVYLSQFDLFRHVEPTRVQVSPGLFRDVLRLFWQAHAVLRRLQG